jgi:ketosteroid isomerase-like protein
MSGIARPAIAVIALASVLFAEQRSADEKKVWSLEDAYWQYVKANDFEHYRTLWHEDFLGWPYSSPEPAGKEQITEWITAHTSKGETLKSYELERLKAQVTGRYATVTYRVSLTWTDKTRADSVQSDITSENAVKTQAWVALSVYVLVAIVKKQLGLDLSLYKILQILSVTVFEKTPILEGFSNFSDEITDAEPCIQLNLFDF